VLPGPVVAAGTLGAAGVDAIIGVEGVADVVIVEGEVGAAGSLVDPEGPGPDPPEPACTGLPVSAESDAHPTRDRPARDVARHLRIGRIEICMMPPMPAQPAILPPD
jgi:hypothetical protein